MERWCENQHRAREDIGKGTWTCIGHLNEARAFRCPYKSMSDAKDRVFPCLDAEPIREPDTCEHDIKFCDVTDEGTSHCVYCRCLAAEGEVKRLEIVIGYETAFNNIVLAAGVDGLATMDLQEEALISMAKAAGKESD